MGNIGSNLGPTKIIGKASIDIKIVMSDHKNVNFFTYVELSTVFSLILYTRGA